MLASLILVAGCSDKAGNQAEETSDSSGGDGSGGAEQTGSETEVSLGVAGNHAGGGSSASSTGGTSSTAQTTVSLCGDGKQTSDEACDDGNTTDGDGCAADCQSVDADYACPDPGEACVPISVCGDDKITGSENCDDGNSAEGDGCSDLCRVETGYSCQFLGIACSPICGDGLVRGDEQCDDGNTTDGDGCTSTCTVQTPTDDEPNGWVCTTLDSDSASTCETTVCGNGTQEGTEQCDDGNNDQGDGCTPFCRLEPQCDYSSTGCKTVCGDGILLTIDIDQQCDDGNTVSGDGCSATCQIESGYTCTTESVEREQLILPVVIRDFKKSGDDNGHPDFQVDSTHAIVSGMVQSVLDSDKKPAHVLETVATTANTYTDGTLDGTDYFSFWYRDDTTETGYNKTLVKTLTFDATTAGYSFSDTTFFPIDGEGWADSATANDDADHNFLFTSEVRYWFQYQGGESLEFIGDDDVWVFVNGQLTVDLGGIHGARAGRVELDSLGNGAVTICNSGDSIADCEDLSTTTVALSMTTASVYEIVVFQAERHTSESNYKLTLGSFDTPRSVCATVCGDGIVTSDEACDLGEANNTGAYGTCTADCKLPAFCGDANVDSADGEACDDGANLATYGYNGTPACNANCQLTDYCGDGIVDSLYGEECDDGNDVSGDECEPNCTHRVNCGDETVDTSVGEECDDGNTVSGDGCSEFCTEEDDILY